jgi:hypothetical protein
MTAVVSCHNGELCPGSCSRLWMEHQSGSIQENHRVVRNNNIPRLCWWSATLRAMQLEIMTMKQTLLISLFVLVSSCGDSKDAAEEQVSAPQIPVATDEYVAPAPSISYAEARVAAVSAIDEAAALGHAWSSSDTLLKEGAAAAEEGNEELAIQLTDNARIQAELSIRQANFEEGAWTERVLSEE